MADHGLAAPYTHKWLRFRDAPDLDVIEDATGRAIAWTDLARDRARCSDLQGLHRALQQAVLHFRRGTAAFKRIEARHALAREKIGRAA